MANLSNIITPSNVLTETSTNTVTNKTINASNNTLTNVSLTTAVTGTLPVANGGTGLTSPGTSGNVLTSNGTTWASAAPSTALPAAAVGAYALMLNNTGSSITLGSSAAGSGLRYAGGGAADWSNSNQASSGTWRLMSGGVLNGGGRVDNNTYGLFLRIA